MKKLVLTTLIAAGLGVAAQGAFAETGNAGVDLLTQDDQVATEGAHGSLQVQGKVVDMTCTIEGNAGQNINVNLPVVSTAQLSGAGKTAGDTPFDIKLTNCVSPKTLAAGARAYFLNNNTNNVDNATGRLKNQATKGAGSVTVELLEGDTVIEVNKQSGNQGTSYKNFTVPDATRNTVGGQNGSVTLTYKARYHAEDGNVTAGPVLAKVEYQIEYQ